MISTPSHLSADAQSGILLVISGPSGVGKTTITHEVVRQLQGVFSISLTSRPPGPYDRDGVDYHFVDAPTFIQKREAGELLEWAEVFGNYYGTPKAPVQEALAQGRLMVLEIDVQGAIQIKQALPSAFAVFILPPSEAVLLDRLRKRKREDEAMIKTRFSKAQAEIHKAKQSQVYDRFVVNDDLELAVNQVVMAVREELARRTEA